MTLIALVFIVIIFLIRKDLTFKRRRIHEEPLNASVLISFLSLVLPSVPAYSRRYGIHKGSYGASAGFSTDNLWKDANANSRRKLAVRLGENTTVNT